MAGRDEERLTELLATVATDNEGINELLNMLRDDVRPWESDIVGVEAMAPTDAGIEVSIRVRCPQADVDILRGVLHELCDDHDEWIVV
jgi:hypothetical protein